MFAKHAERELAGIYSGTGNAEDQRRVALRVKQVEGRVQGMQPWRDPANQARMARFRKEAILVQCFGTFSGRNRRGRCVRGNSASGAVAAQDSRCEKGSAESGLLDGR